MKIRLRIFCNVLLLLIGFVSASIRDGDDDETFVVVRAHPNTTDQLNFVRELHDNMHTYDLDFWLTPHLVGQMADVMVRESRLPWLKDRLGEMGISHFVSIPDVQKLIIDREQKSKNSKFSQLIEGFRKRYHDEGGNRAKYGFGDYHSYDTIIEWMNEIERQYPDRAKVITIGQTDEGRPIKTIKLGTNIHNTARKVIWMDGGIHAREWAAVHTTAYFIDRLIADYETDPIVREAMDNLHFYVTPVLNPDGYEFSRTGVSPMIRLWRKNRSNMVCKKDRWFRDRCCGGVDLNRNFDWFWGEIGSSSDRCSEIYQGSAVWSEAESRAVRDMVFSPELRGKIEAFITLHTYSQMWIHPFSHQRKTVPEDIAETEEVGRRAVAALEGMYGTKYRFGTGADILYPSAGGSDDWAKGKGGAKFVYLLELRPGEEVWDGFILDSRQLMPTAKETWAGVKVVIEAVNKRNRRAAPPVVATSSIFDKFIALKSFLVDVVKTLFTDSKKEETTTTTTTTTSVEPPTTAFPTTLRSKASFEHFTRRLDDLTTSESTTLEAITEAVTTTTLTTVSTTEAPLTLKFLNVHEEMIAEHTSSTTTLTTLKNAATILSSTSTSTTATTAMSTMSTNVPELQVNAASSTSEADTTSKPSSTKTHFSSTASVAVTTVGVKITQPQLGSKLDESTTDQAGASTTTTSPSTTATEVLSSTATPFETTTSSLLQNMMLEKSSVSRFSTPIQDSTTSTTTTPSSTLSVILVKQPQLERKLDAETSTTSETSSTAIISPSSTADTPSVAASTVKAATTTLSVDVFPFSADPRLFEVSSTASTKTDSSTDVTEVREILLTTSTSTSTTTPVTVPSETTISSNASTTTAVAEQIKEVTITSTTAPETSTEPVYSTVTSTVETKSKQTPKVIIWTISEPLEEITSENSRIAVESEISSSSLLTKGLATSTTPAPIEQSTTSPVLDEGSLFASVEQTIPLVKLITTTVHSTVEEVATAPSTLAGLESSRATKLLEEKLKEGTTTATTVEDTTQMSVLSTNSEDLVKTSPSSPIVTEKPEILTEEPLKLIQLTLFQEANPVSTPKPVNISDFAESEDAVLPVIPKDMNEAFSIGQRVMEQLEKGLPEDLEQVEVSAALGKEKEEEEEYEDSGEVDAPETAEEASTADAPPLNATTTTPEITTPALPTTVPTSFASLSSKVTPTTVEVVEVTTVPSTTTRFQVSEITTTSSASIPETSTAEVTPNHHHLSIDDLEEEVLPPVIVTGVLASTGLLAAKALQKTASNHKEASTPQPPPKLHHHVETLRSSAETSATSKPVHHVLVPVHMKGNRNPPGIKPQLATPLPPLRTTPTMVPVMHTSPQPMKVSSKPAHPKDEVQSTTKPPVDPTLVALETHLELSVPPPPPTDEQIQVNPSAQDHEMTTRAPTTKRRPTTRRKTTRHHHRRTKKPRTNTQSPVSNPGHTTTARPGNAVAASRKFRTRHFIVPTTVATTTTSTTTTTTTETPTTAFVAERIEIVRPRLGSRRNRTRPVLMGREETRVLLAERFRQQQARLEERRQESRRRGQSGSAVRVVSGNVENRTPVVESFKQPAPAFQQQPQQPQALCIDRSPWCGAWIHGNPSICQISSIYMRRDCARSCRYCS